MSSSKALTAVSLDGDEYDVIRATGTQVVLVSRTDGQTVVKAPAELGAVAPAGRVGRVRAVADLDGSHSDRIGLLADHLEEVATGVWRDGNIRPDYDPATTSQEVRVQRKLKELKVLGISWSRATLYRKLTAYRGDGRSGLLDGRWLRTFDPMQHIPAPVLDALLDVLNETTHDSTRTRGYVISQVKRRVQREFGVGYELPSRASMYRYLDILAGARYLRGRAATRRSAAERPNKTFTKNMERVPGAQVQVDSTKLNVLVKTAGAHPERPTLTIMLDVATRMILAFTLRLSATKAVDHVYLIGQALTPRQNRPNVTGFRDFLQTHMPDHQLMPAEEYSRHAAQQPYVRPRRVLSDNGKDYTSQTVRAAMERFSIDATLSAPHTPTNKGSVERTFGTIDSLFTQNLPGYVGRAVVDRGYKPEDEDLLTLPMVWALLDDWVMRDYHHRPHDSLRDPQLPRRKISPLEAASNAAMDVAQFVPPLSEISYISLLEKHWRAISDIGVQYGTRHYDAVELHPLRNTKSSHPRHSGKWPIRVDPYNPDFIWVERAPDTFIQCQERGIGDRDLQPVFEPVVQDRRVLTAQFDAAVTGTPMPQPVIQPAALPAASTAAEGPDDFDYDTI